MFHEWYSAGNSRAPILARMVHGGAAQVVRKKLFGRDFLTGASPCGQSADIRLLSYATSSKA